MNKRFSITLKFWCSTNSRKETKFAILALTLAQAAIYRPVQKKADLFEKVPPFGRPYNGIQLYSRRLIFEVRPRGIFIAA